MSLLDTLAHVTVSEDSFAFRLLVYSFFLLLGGSVDNTGSGDEERDAARPVQRNHSLLRRGTSFGSASSFTDCHCEVWWFL